MFYPLYDCILSRVRFEELLNFPAAESNFLAFVAVFRAVPDALVSIYDGHFTLFKGSPLFPLLNPLVLSKTNFNINMDLGIVCYSIVL